MPTEEIYAGRKFTIEGWVENGRCQVLEFLEKLANDGDSDAERLYNLLKRIADEGVTFSQRQVRALQDDIFEFKAPNTGRILFFYDKGQLIICACGFTGKKGNEQKFIARQTKKASRIRKDYFHETR